ncbi:MAG: hypothetical protein K2Y21_15560 [Phycisphaerales bacterium]|nr:hypothetical protein [Phycisphaerales bacterium]
MKNVVLAVTAIAGIAASANAAWGYKYQVSTDGGATWSSNAVVNVTGGAATVNFRVVAFADAGTLSSLALPPGADGSSTNQVVAFARYTGSEKFTNFGAAANGDMLNAGMTRGELSSQGATYLSSSLSGGSLIVGGTTATSFASQLLLAGPLSAYTPSSGGTPDLEWVIRAGSIKVGNSTVGAQNRIITFTNNNRTGGGTWYRDALVNGVNDVNAGAPVGTPINIDGTITVVPTTGSLALVGLGGLVAARRRRA